MRQFVRLGFASAAAIAVVSSQDIDQLPGAPEGLYNPNQVPQAPVIVPRDGPVSASGDQSGIFGAMRQSAMDLAARAGVGGYRNQAPAEVQPPDQGALQGAAGLAAPLAEATAVVPAQQMPAALPDNAESNPAAAIESPAGAAATAPEVTLPSVSPANAVGTVLQQAPVELQSNGDQPTILVPLEEGEVPVRDSYLDITMGDAGNIDRWVVVQRQGDPNQQFSCGPKANKLYQVSAAVAASDIMIASSGGPVSNNNDDAKDFWNGLSPWMNMWRGGEDDNRDMILEFVSISASSDNAEILTVYMEPEVETGGLMLGSEDSIRVVYVCQNTGDATVHLNATTAAGEEICLRWTKNCQPSWNGMKILQAGTGLTVWDNNHVNNEWQIAAGEAARLEKEHAALSNSMSFILTHPMSDGTVRVKDAKVSTDNAAFNVTLRGAFQGANREPLSIGNDDTEQLDVVYQCSVDDSTPQLDATVTLTLTNESPIVPPLTISWPAACGQGKLGEVTAAVSSCSLAGVPGDTLIKDSLALTDGVVADSFSSNPMIIGEKDDCTSFTFSSSSKDSVVELFPRHQLTYDRKIVAVANKVGSVKTSIEGDPVLRIPYVCIGDGSTLVQLTVHFKDRPSTDFVWHKRCLEPKVHKIGGPTGASILAWSLAASLTAFLLFFISRSKTLSRFLCRKFLDCICCFRRRSSPLSDEQAQFTTFGAAV